MRGMYVIKTYVLILGCTTTFSAGRMTIPPFETVTSSDSAPSPTPRLPKTPPVVDTAVLKHQSKATNL